MKKSDYKSLANDIAELLSDYKKEIDEEVKSITTKVIKQAKDEIVRISPKESGEYADGWTISLKQNGKNLFSKAVHNKKLYRLTHLLEFGHATKNGGHTNAQPHIRATEEKYKEIFVSELEGRTRR